MKSINLQRTESLLMELIPEALSNLVDARINSLNDVFTKEKTSTVIIDNKEYRINIKRDVGKIAVKKPKLVQDIINRGTLNAFGCFEKITDKNFKGDMNVCK